MAKRKRDPQADGEAPKPQKAFAAQQHAANRPATPVSLQIITGSYERVLHGLTATVDPQPDAKAPSQNSSAVKFADTFLFNAHASAIRCLALSPPSGPSDPKAQKVILASGSTDERINLYQLSTAPPPAHSQPSIPTLTGTPSMHNPKNREMGSLMHHSSNIGALHFPSRSKLFSGADDNTIAIARTRDWTVLSTIKAPIPKAHGRPSGDTAAPGEVPSGINDFAVHPSQKLMISVSKGEKCMRLWNVMTGRKASVLTFDREMLQNVGEGKWSTGEGRKVKWSPDGEEWVVAFERGFVVFGLDSRPMSQTLPRPMTKIHQVHYVPGLSQELGNIIAISTEDGRILFYSTKETRTPAATSQAVKTGKEAAVPSCKLIAQLGGRAADLTGRIKDFEILPVSEAADEYYIATGSSDGAVRVWHLSQGDLCLPADDAADGDSSKQPDAGSEKAVNVSDTLSAKQVGELIGAHETGNRITCLKAFIMNGTPEEDDDAPMEETEASSSDDSDSE
ncbi:60s ribosome biogenesis protein mak11 [Diplodia corticola]|uniref:60s ribosome biogenesis protein mak11 n=1 Tax=Diplodia corticola TaxID=236234 RepID=A0A1J9QRQ7_9PEZI|nr:60s ribosome biogenesis protein mak11 [Diplodia corticola]OJD31136.1 60s ribosome biogenesis protein mak11 [Diplodia corticola]